MTRILVACATRHGSTAEIAAEIADVLRRNVPGAVVDLREAAKAGEVAGYDAAVIGSAVYMGRWLPTARDLVEGHREVLSAMPVWLFSSGPSGIRQCRWTSWPKSRRSASPSVPGDTGYSPDG